MWSVVLLAIDPGLRGCGVACFRDTGPAEGIAELLRAGYAAGSPNAVRSEAWLTTVRAVKEFVGSDRVTELVVELPQVYRFSRSKGDPNDLIQLAAVVGALCEAFAPAQQRIYLPAEWKGQVSKDVLWERACKRLTPEEEGRVVCRQKTLLHNARDAVVLGLQALGRMR
jgi:hypothetical protein